MHAMQMTLERVSVHDHCIYNKNKQTLHLMSFALFNKTKERPLTERQTAIECRLSYMSRTCFCATDLSLWRKKASPVKDSKSTQLAPRR